MLTWNQTRRCQVKHFWRVRRTNKSGRAVKPGVGTPANAVPSPAESMPMGLSNSLLPSFATPGFLGCFYSRIREDSAHAPRFLPADKEWDLVVTSGNDLVAAIEGEIPGRQFSETTSTIALKKPWVMRPISGQPTRRGDFQSIAETLARYISHAGRVSGFHAPESAASSSRRTLLTMNSRSGRTRRITGEFAAACVHGTALRRDLFLHIQRQVWGSAGEFKQPSEELSIRNFAISLRGPCGRACENEVIFPSPSRRTSAGVCPAPCAAAGTRGRRRAGNYTPSLTLPGLVRTRRLS